MDTPDIALPPSTAFPCPDPGAALPVPPALVIDEPRTTITRSQLAARIAAGETLVLRGRVVYKLDAWLSRHPGGALAILHFVGRDAQDEIEAYHSDSALERMRHFAIATLVLPGDQRYPAPASAAAQADQKAERLLCSADRIERDEEPALTAQQAPVYHNLVPPIQLGYRKPTGLDHPHAQLNTWELYLRRIANLHADGKQDQLPEEVSWPPKRPVNFPLPPLLLEPRVDDPSLDATWQAAISADYRALHRRMRADGMYKLHFWWGYGREIVRYTLLALTAWWVFRVACGTAHGSWQQCCLFAVSSFFTGLAWHQVTFVAHDAGHDEITHNHFVDQMVGTLIADLIGGLSLGWWTNNHDTHHLVTNHTEHDPDIQHLPFLAISPKFLVYQTDPDTDAIAAASNGSDGAEPSNGSKPQGPPRRVTHGLWTTYYGRVMLFDRAAKLLVALQHKLYYIIMGLARFNLYAQSYIYLIVRAQRDFWWYLELSLLPFYWVWMWNCILKPQPSWGSRIVWLLISHVVASPLHVQIVLSHFGQSTDEQGSSESFPSRQLRTTMDVQCAESIEFIHGGLHMQVTHHLFPRLPRHNLRMARDRYVRPWAEKWGLPYEEYTFVKGNLKVLGVLRSVANQVDILSQVAAARADGKL